jgi:hypothetical protein
MQYRNASKTNITGSKRHIFWLDGKQQNWNVRGTIKKNTFQKASNWFFDANPGTCRKVHVLLLMKLSGFYLLIH